MKIEASILKTFLEKINIKNKINECKLNFEEEGVTTVAKTQDNITMMMAKMSKSAFVEYEKIGEIGIANIKRFIDVLNRFGSEPVSLKKESNLIKMVSQNKEAELMLPNLDFIESIEKTPVLEYKKVFKLNVSYFNEAFKNAEILKDSGEESTIKITSTKGVLILETGYGDKMREKISAPNIEEGLKVKFPEILGDIFSLLEGETEVSLKTNYPICVEKKLENIKVKYIVAPITSE